jgi:hypothetical protein
MRRSELKEVIGDAADKAGVTGTNRTRLVNSADLTDRIAVGAFKINKPGLTCGCPATVAGLWNPEPNGGWTDTDPSLWNFPAIFDTDPRLDAQKIQVDSDGAFIPVTD